MTPDGYIAHPLDKAAIREPFMIALNDKLTSLLAHAKGLLTLREWKFRPGYHPET